jgi:predicted amidohydrolase
MPLVRVALCQMNSRDDVEANLRQAGELLEKAAAGGADLAGLPEVWTYMGSAGRHREVAEPVPGRTSQWLSEIARRHGMWILGGSVLEAGEDGKVFNTSLLVDRAGELVAHYRKIHLFDVELPGQPPIRESFSYTPGEEIVTAETEFGRVGLSICYDVRFPELYRALVARGAEILFVPSAFTFETGKDHWDVLLRARAIEGQAFVLAPAQWGTWGRPESNRRSYGNSLAVDPWGTVIARAPHGVGVTFAELDLEEVRRVRERLPALRHRRLGPSC